MTTQPSDTQRKVVGTALIALATTIVGSAWVLYYLGFFTSPTVSKGEPYQYRIAYLEHVGPYDKTHHTIDRVGEILAEANIPTIAAASIYVDDPATTPENKRRAKAGYLVEWNITLPDGVEVEIFDPGYVARASFEGSPIIGSYKAYKAIRQWSRGNGYTLSLPVLEIYYEDEERIEYHVPINDNRPES